MAAHVRGWSAWWLSPLVVTALVVLLGAPVGPAAAGPAAQTNGCTTTTSQFVAWLSGAQEVPAVTTTAWGVASIQLSPDGTSAAVTIITNNLDVSTVTAAHIHSPAPVGVNAGVSVNLFTGPSGSFTSPYVIGVTIPAATLTAMLNGQAYVNVHTAANPGGVIRGQIACGGIVPANASTTQFAAVSTGAQEVPPNTSAAYALTTIQLNGDGTMTITTNSTGLDITTVTAAHVHSPGVPGVNAGVTAGFFTGPTGSFTNPHVATVPVSPAVIDDMRAGRAYVNYHTVALPGGEIRGQIGAPAPAAAPAGVTVTKQAVDLNGGDLLPGDVVEYTVTVTNQGTGPATGVTLLDPIPTGTSYQAGSLSIASGANTGPKTDPAGDDQAEFDGANNRVAFRLGTGATATAGGTLGPGGSSAARFRVLVNSTTPVGSSINNQASVTFTNLATGTSGSASGTAGPTPVVPEWSPLWLFGSGLLALGWLARRHRRRR